MKTSVSINDTSILPFIANAGFDSLDFSFYSYDKRNKILADDYEHEILEFYKLAKQTGLIISQVHLTFYPGHYSPIGDGTYKAFEEEMLPIIIKEIEIAASINCKKAVIHLYFENDIENSRKGNIKLISKLLPYLEKYSITLCIENIYGPNFSNAHLSTAEELLFYADYFNNEHIGICLDTGHALILGQDPLNLAKKLGQKIKALHVHTNHGELDEHLIPFSKGDTIEWNKFYSVLLSNGYLNTFNLEIRCIKNATDEEKTAYYKLAHEAALKILNNKISIQPL